MKKHTFKTVLALLLLCIFLPVKTMGQEVVKNSTHAFKFKAVEELANDENWKTKLACTKDTYKYKEVKVVTLPNGTVGILGTMNAEKREQKGAFQLLDSESNIIYGYTPFTSLSIDKIDDKDYIQLFNRNTSQYSLYDIDGKQILNNGPAYTILKCGSHIVFRRFGNEHNSYYDLNGELIHYGLSNTTNESFHYVPEVKPEIKPVIVDDNSIEMLCAATPEYMYTSGKTSGISSDFLYMSDISGNKLFNGSSWNKEPYPSVETGYFIEVIGKPAFEIKEIDKEVNGEIATYRCLTLKNQTSKGKLFDCNRKIVENVYGIEYSAPDHSIKYKVKEGKRELKGAIFLRDAKLNVPPLFADVMYKLDEKTNEWKPYVRRTLFGPSEPYVAGMDATPDYQNDIERDIENDNLYAHQLGKRYGDDHKWSARDLAYIDYFCSQKANSTLDTFEANIDISEKASRPISEIAATGKNFLSITNGQYNLKSYQIALSLYEKAKTNYAEENVPAMAENMIEVTKNKLKNAQERTTRLEKRFRLAIEQHEKNISEEAKLTAVREYRRSLTPEITKSNRERNENNRMMGLLILNAVVRNVGNVLGRALGGRPTGNQLRVTYVGGAGGYNAPVNGGAVNTSAGTTGTSSGAAVQTAKKCGRCNGTGSCNACLGHPGKATAGSKSPNCSACHGSGRCTYCGGSGYRN